MMITRRWAIIVVGITLGLVLTLLPQISRAEDGHVGERTLRRRWVVRLQRPPTFVERMLSYSFTSTDDHVSDGGSKPISDRDHAQEIANELGLRYVDRVVIGDEDGYYLVEEDDPVAEYTAEDVQQLHSAQPWTTAHAQPLPEGAVNEKVQALLESDPRVEWFEEQVFRRREKRTVVDVDFNDLDRQRYVSALMTDVPPPVHQDLFVRGLWEQGVNGTGVTVALIDDGLEVWHEDLRSAYVAQSSWDILYNRPLSSVSDRVDNHGTRCAGQIVSKPNNSVCGVGVAFGSSISGLRLISSDQHSSDAMEATAVTFKYFDNDIYSASWGPKDDGKTIDGPGTLTQKALEVGVTKGRAGLGSIYVFASGNGGVHGDNCNFDGYANNIHTITIGAVNGQGKIATYGELCAAQFASTFSGGSSDQLMTTDIDLNCETKPCCTLQHTGTSAAAPFASAMIALVLGFREQLSWRDIQHIIVRSTQMTDVSDEDWTTNGGGYHINHKYGFGVLNGEKMLEVARTFRRVPGAKQWTVESQSLAAADEGIVSIVAGKTVALQIEVGRVGSTLSGETLTATTGIHTLEHVQLRVDIRHVSRRHLIVSLISPSGTVSQLTNQRPLDVSRDGFVDWTFMTVRHWDEPADGVWTLRLEDKRSTTATSADAGTLKKWKLMLWGIPCTPEEWLPVDGGNGTMGAHRCPTEPIPTSMWTLSMIIGVAAGSVLVLLSILAIAYRYRERIGKGLKVMRKRLFAPSPLQWSHLPENDDQLQEILTVSGTGVVSPVKRKDSYLVGTIHGAGSPGPGTYRNDVKMTAHREGGVEATFAHAAGVPVAAVGGNEAGKQGSASGLASSASSLHSTIARTSSVKNLNVSRAIRLDPLGADMGQLRSPAALDIESLGMPVLEHESTVDRDETTVRIQQRPVSATERQALSNAARVSMSSSGRGLSGSSQLGISILRSNEEQASIAARSMDSPKSPQSKAVFQLLKGKRPQPPPPSNKK